MTLRSVEENASPWISTKERLPEVGATVLAYWPSISIQKDAYPAMYGVATYQRRSARHELNRQIWHNPEAREDEFSIPEYWMPLPEVQRP
jgi:hypothetical protein